jgi:hypothetical protein
MNCIQSKRDEAFFGTFWHFLTTIGKSQNHYSYKKVVETESLWFLILMGVTIMEKKSSGLPFMPLLHNAFWALFGAPGWPGWPRTTFNINFPTFPI